MDEGKKEVGELYNRELRHTARKKNGRSALTTSGGPSFSRKSEGDLKQTHSGSAGDLY